MKFCSKCGEDLPLDMFWKRKTSPDGHMTVCKICEYTRKRKWTIANRDKCTMYANRYNEKNREKEREKQKVYDARRNFSYRVGTLKYNSRHILRENIRLGLIERPEICSICQEKKRIQAHHPDYEEPLNVVWCCAQCHMRFFHRRKLQLEN